MFRKIVLSIGIVLCAGSCAEKMSVEYDKLVRAEEVMQEFPDSALCIIESVDYSLLCDGMEKAYFALLLTQAEDKNYIDRTSDSIISKAVRYYKDSEDIYHKMLSYYYLARIQYNNKVYDQSILNLLRAEDFAREIEDDFYLGLIYRSFTYIYNDIYSRQEALRYARLSYEHFSLSGKQNYIDWALYNVARMYNNMHSYDECIDVIQEVIVRLEQSGNLYLLAESKRLLGLSSFAIKDYNTARRVLSEVVSDTSNELNSQDISVLGITYLRCDMPDSAEYYMHLLDGIDKSNHHLKYEYYNYIGDSAKALKALEKELKYYNSALNDVVKQTVSLSLANYHELEKQFVLEKIRRERVEKIGYVLFFVVLIVFILIFLLHKIKEQRNEVEKNMNLASTLKQSLEEMSLKKRISSDEIAQLFKQKFSMIDDLCSIYYECQGTEGERRRIYNQTMKLIHSVNSDSDTFSDLENLINKYNDDILVKFKYDFPNIKEQDYLLFVYLLMGFSPRSISILLKQDCSVLYNRKTRLKKKIANLHSGNIQEYLNALD